MTVKSRATCYMCGQVATTKEHFPPKAFFPRGGNLKLKTVPSCKAHNNDKSGDDQYLLAHICMNAAGGENLAKKIFLRSIAPQVMYSDAFRRRFNDGAEWLPEGSRSCPVDVARFDRFFDSLCCAVFFVRYDRQFDPNTHSLSHFYLSLKTKDPIEHARKMLASSMIADFFTRWSILRLIRLTRSYILMR